MSFVSDWMPSRWDISFKTERDLRHDPAQVAKNARFGVFDGFIEGQQVLKMGISHQKLSFVSRTKT